MRRKKEQTRADYYGIKASTLARTAEAKLTRMREKILKLQEPWAETDPLIESATNTAVDAINALIQQYRDSAAYLNEPME